MIASEGADDDPGGVLFLPCANLVDIGVGREVFDRPVERGFICYTRSNYKVVEVAIDTAACAEAERIVREVRDIIQQGIDEGLFRQGDPKMIGFAIMGGMDLGMGALFVMFIVLMSLCGLLATRLPPPRTRSARRSRCRPARADRAPCPHRCSRRRSR